MDHTSIPNHQHFRVSKICLNGIRCQKKKRNSSKNAPGIMNGMVRSSKMWEVQNWDGLTFSRPPALMFFFPKTAHLKFSMEISCGYPEHCIIQSQVYKHIFLRVDTSMSWGLIEKPGLFWDIPPILRNGLGELAGWMINCKTHIF